MSTSRIVLTLNAQERGALEVKAAQELRDVRDQARVMLRLQLTNEGLLKHDKNTTAPHEESHPSHH